MVILIIVFVLATNTLLIIFRWDNKCLRRKHLIANKKSTQNRLIKDLKLLPFGIWFKYSQFVLYVPRLSKVTCASWLHVF